MFKYFSRSKFESFGSVITTHESQYQHELSCAPPTVPSTSFHLLWLNLLLCHWNIGCTYHRLLALEAGSFSGTPPSHRLLTSPSCPTRAAPRPFYLVSRWRIGVRSRRRRRRLVLPIGGPIQLSCQPYGLWSIQLRARKVRKGSRVVQWAVALTFTPEEEAIGELSGAGYD